MNQPISREELRKLKGKTDALRRIEIIRKIVSEVYSGAVTTAKHSNSTQFRHTVPIIESLYNFSRVYDSEYILNMNEILGELRYLFPGCSVKQMFVFTRDEPETVSPEKNKHPFFEDTDGTMYIIVDWT